MRAGIPGREKRMGWSARWWGQVYLEGRRGWVGQHASGGRYTWKGEEDGLVSTLVRAGIPGREKRMGWSARW